MRATILIVLFALATIQAASIQQDRPQDGADGNQTDSQSGNQSGDQSGSLPGSPPSDSQAAIQPTASGPPPSAPPNATLPLNSTSSTEASDVSSTTEGIITTDAPTN